MLYCKSFSLIEVLVAVTVITVGLIGVIGLVIYNLSISRISPERVIAINLAQEGLEAARNIRDNNWVDPASPAWDNGLQGNPIGKNYILEFSTLNDPSSGFFLQSGGTDDIDKTKYQVYFNATNKFYYQNSSGPGSTELPDFHRLIEITKIDSSHLKIIAYVTWTDRNENINSITLEEHLYDYDMPTRPTKYKWESVGSAGRCLVIRRLNGSDCTFYGSSDTYVEGDCRECCLDLLCTNVYYLAPWDYNARYVNPIISEPSIGDPDYVCDVRYSTHACALYEKVSY